MNKNTTSWIQTLTLTPPSLKDNTAWVLTEITEAEDPTPIAGLAVDLGTTRVVLRLLDLATGRCWLNRPLTIPRKRSDRTS